MSTTAIVRRLLPYAWRRRGPMLVVALAMLVNVALAALAPWPMKVIVDNALGDRPLPGWLASAFVALPGPASREAMLWWAAGATVVVFVLGWAASLALSWAGVRFGQRMAYDVAGDLFAHLQRLSLRFHARHGLGSLLRRITVDSGCVSTIVKDALLPAVAAAVSVVTMLVVMWALDPALTLVALGVIPVMLLAMQRFSAPMLERSYEQQAAEGEMYEVLEQTLTGLPVVKAFGQEPAADARFAGATDRILASTMAMTWAQFRFRILVGSATALGTAAVFWVGAGHGLDGTLTVGTLLVFLAYLASLYGPLEEMTYTSSTITEAAGSARRVLEVLDAPTEVVDGPRRIAGARGHVVLEDVAFGYEPGRRVLHGVSLEARPGEVVAIVGSTGAGKSTLVSLVPRFFDPEEGRVLLDGRDLRKLRVAGLRAQVSIVLQESFLFPCSIGDNIAFGRPRATPAQIEAAARAANAHAFISRLPDGYGTVVGERGATLSGGERQRIAIARALLKDAPVLVLDEPTSALDAETEHLLLGALERLMVGRTTLIIAHRLSTVRRADQIVVLEHGRVVERGTHHELVALDGTYARMHAIQHGVAA